MFLERSNWIICNSQKVCIRVYLKLRSHLTEKSNRGFQRSACLRNTSVNKHHYYFARALRDIFPIWTLKNKILKACKTHFDKTKLGNNISRIAMLINTWTLSGDWILMAYKARMNSKKYTQNIYFSSFDYSAHPKLCSDTVILWYNTCCRNYWVLEWVFFMEPGQVRSMDLHALAYMFDLRFYLGKWTHDQKLSL